MTPRPCTTKPEAALTCVDCAAPVKGRSKTGRCLSCACRYACRINPELRQARVRAGKKCAAMYAQDIAERARTIGLAAMGRAARTPESFRKLSRSVSETRMAWCPPELRDEARRLTYMKGIPLAEVKPMILDLHRAQMDRFRQGLLITLDSDAGH